MANSLGIVDRDGSLAGLASTYRRQGVDVSYSRGGGRMSGTVVIATNNASPESPPERTVGGNIAAGRFESSRTLARALLDLPITPQDDDIYSGPAVEVTMGGWFDYRKGRFLRPVWSALTKRRLCVGDVGPAVGPMTTLVWTWRQPRPVLFQKTIEKFETRLTGYQYLGPFTADFLVGRDTKFISCGCRGSWEPIFAAIGGLPELTRLLEDSADGFLPSSLLVAGLWMYAIEDGVSIATETDDLRIVPQKLPRDRTKGQTLAVYTHPTTSVEAARAELYEIIEWTIGDTDLCYRTDAASVDHEADLRVLGALGFGPAPIITRGPALPIPVASEASSDRRSRQRRASAATSAPPSDD